MERIWYLNYIYELERQSAKYIHQLNYQDNENLKKRITFIEDVNLNREQNDFVKFALDEYKIILLTGFPGTGKTHVVAHLVNIYLHYGKRVHVCALSSVAAYVLKSRCAIGTTWSTMKKIFHVIF